MMRFLLALSLLHSHPQQSAPDECGFIRAQLQSLSSAGGEILIPAGTFQCRDKIIVRQSNVKIRGAGRGITILKLADQSPSPVLVIGDDRILRDQNGNWVTATRVSNIDVSDLSIDGNLANQDPRKECGNGSCDGNLANIRNNAITIRGASYVNVIRVTTYNAVSGGLVTEKYCDHLHVQDFTSYGNHFDGFAGYQTVDSLFENMNLSRNRGAGISIDIDFNNNKFSGGVLGNNGDVGIFARFIHHVIFENLTISDSGNHGAFLADTGYPNTCANDNEFRSVIIQGSKGYGINIASACTNNKLTANSILEKNKNGCFYVHPKTTMTVDPTVECQN